MTDCDANCPDGDDGWFARVVQRHGDSETPEVKFHRNSARNLIETSLKLHNVSLIDFIGELSGNYLLQLMVYDQNFTYEKSQKFCDLKRKYIGDL